MKLEWIAAYVALTWLIASPGLAGPLFLSATKQIDYETAVNDISLAINNHGYTPVKIQPVDEGLRAKGYETSEYKLIFFGDKPQLDKILAVTPEAAVMLPLRIILYQEGGVVIASAPSMEMWKGVFGGEALNSMINQWQKDVLSILREFSKQ
ncbi:MAG: DUF302 domain-containing protein [Thiobacillus sp.]